MVYSPGADQRSVFRSSSSRRFAKGICFSSAAACSATVSTTAAGANGSTSAPDERQCEQHLLFDQRRERQLLRHSHERLVAARHLSRLRADHGDQRRFVHRAGPRLQATLALQHHHTGDAHVDGCEAVEGAKAQLRLDTSPGQAARHCNAFEL
jgi:hypothetical protein